MYLMTMSTSHISEYQGWGGLTLWIPFNNLMTIGCCPIGVPSFWLWVIETADLMALIDWCCNPWTKSSAKNTHNICEKGSVCCWTHQQSHLCHANWYAVFNCSWAPTYHDKLCNFFRNSFCKVLFPDTYKWQAAEYPAPSLGASGLMGRWEDFDSVVIAWNIH